MADRRSAESKALSPTGGIGGTNVKGQTSNASYVPTGNARVDQGYYENQAANEQYQQSRTAQYQQQDSRSNEQRNAQFESLNEQARSNILRSSQRQSQEEQQARNESQTSTSDSFFDEGGTVTYKEKKSFSRESRQQVKDFLGKNPAEQYQVFDTKGNLLFTTSRRRAYPDILKASLSKEVSVSPYSKPNPNQQYVALGVGNPLFTVEQPPKKDYRIFPTPGQEQKPQWQGPTKSLIQTSMEKSPLYPILNPILGDRLFERPTTNLITDIKNIATGSQDKTKPTVMAQAISAGAAYLTPATRSLFASPGLIRKSTAEENQTAQTAIPNFLNQTQTELEKNPKEVIIPLLGEVALLGGPQAVFKGAGGALDYIKGTRAMSQASKDIRGIFGPKEVATARITEKISAKPATGLSKGIGGEILITPKITFEKVGGNRFKLESMSEKQNKLVTYDVNKKILSVIESPKKVETPESFNLRGPLSDTTKTQVEQQKTFGLTQVNKDLFKTVEPVKPELTKAIESNGGPANIGTVKEFTLEQVQKDKSEFGSFLFGTGKAPTPPKTAIGLLETKGYGTVGMDIPKSRVKDVFEPFKEGKVKSFVSEKPDGAIKYLTTTKHLEKTFIKKNPTTSYVTDVQKNIRFVDPFSKSSKTISGIKIDVSKLGTTKEGFGKYPTGNKPTKLITETKAGRDEISRLIENENKQMDILFSKPRFDKAYGLYGGAGSVLLSSSQVSPVVPPGYKMVESPQRRTGGNSKIFKDISNVRVSTRKNEDRYASKLLGGGLIPAISPKQGLTNKINQDIFSKETVRTTPFNDIKITSDIIPKLTPDIKQLITQRTTPKTTTQLIPDLSVPGPNTNIIIREIKEPIIPFEGFLNGPLSSRGGGGSAALLGETADFFGNVPQESIWGVYGKRQEITYHSGGLHAPKEKQTKRTKGSRTVFNLLGKQPNYQSNNLNSLLSTSPARKSKRSKKSKSSNGLSLLGGKSSKSFSLFSNGKQKKFRL